MRFVKAPASWEAMSSLTVQLPFVRVWIVPFWRAGREGVGRVAATAVRVCRGRPISERPYDVFEDLH